MGRREDKKPSLHEVGRGLREGCLHKSRSGLKATRVKGGYFPDSLASLRPPTEGYLPLLARCYRCDFPGGKPFVPLSCLFLTRVAFLGVAWGSKKVVPLIFLALSLILAACARESLPKTPPVFTPATPPVAPLSCADFLPPGDRQYMHAIRFELAGGGGGSAIGVVVLIGREIRCALTTVEGLTLFEARSSGGDPPEVMRALPPFDKPVFAANLFKDIRTLFLPPLGLVRQGQLADHSRVCRYETEDGATADLMETHDGCWRLQTYNPDAMQNRSVRAYSCEYTSDSGLVPAQLELTAPAYTLRLRLISAQRLESVQ